MFGFFGRILTVDLGARSFAVDTVEPGLLEAVLGGKGLGLALLLARNPAGADPLGPDNRLIFATGPLGASPAWGGGRCGLFTRSPLTGGCCEVFAGGPVPAAVDRTGFDAVVVQGASDAPVAVSIHPEGCDFHEADHIWGLETPDAEGAARSSLGQDRPGFGPPVAVIAGPAGERRVRCATIASNGRPWPGGAGAGAVLGAKRLKAVVFQGDRRRPLPDPEGLAALADGFARAPGTPPMPRNRAPVLKDPECEALVAFGGQCLIEGMAEIAWLGDLCRRLGLDIPATGDLLALAIEACRRGSLDLELTPGDFEGVARLIHDIADRSGAGDLLARGIAPAAAAWGLSDLAGQADCPGWTVPCAGTRLACGIASGGVCFPLPPRVSPAWTRTSLREGMDSRARWLVDCWDRLTVQDMLLLGRGQGEPPPWDVLARAVELATGLAVTREGLKRRAEQVLGLSRAFDMREGCPAEDEGPVRRLLKDLFPDAWRLAEEDARRLAACALRLRGRSPGSCPGT